MRMVHRSKKIAVLVYIFFLCVVPQTQAETVTDGLLAYLREDYSTAIEILKPLAEQGDMTSQYYLGVMHAIGQGVPQDYKKAVKWYTKAAEQGHAGSQFELGVMLKNGEGVPQDYKEATKWYTKAAEQGDADAQGNLGAMYFNGYGVLQDYVQAYAWWNIGASQGNAYAKMGRDLILKKMSPDQIAKGQEISKQLYKKIYGEIKDRKEQK